MGLRGLQTFILLAYFSTIFADIVCSSLAHGPFCPQLLGRQLPLWASDGQPDRNIVEADAALIAKATSMILSKISGYEMELAAERARDDGPTVLVLEIDADGNLVELLDDPEGAVSLTETTSQDGQGDQINSASPGQHSPLTDQPNKPRLLEKVREQFRSGNRRVSDDEHKAKQFEDVQDAISHMKKLVAALKADRKTTTAAARGHPSVHSEEADSVPQSTPSATASPPTNIN